MKNTGEIDTPKCFNLSTLSNSALLMLFFLFIPDLQGEVVLPASLLQVGDLPPLGSVIMEGISRATSVLMMMVDSDVAPQ